MATEAEIQSKRESIAKKREEVRLLRAAQAVSAAEAGRDTKLAVLTAEEQSLEAELSALRAAAPAPAAPAAPTPKTTSSDAAENKE